MIISNLPSHKTKTDYHQVIKKQVLALEQLPWVKRVMQMGSVGCPGISDIDLIVVTQDSGFDGTGHAIKNKDNEYYFLHDALWLREQDLERLPNIFCTNKVFEPVTSVETSIAKKFTLTDEQKLIYLIEITFNKLLQLVNSQVRNINARGLMTRASSVVHSVALADDLQIPNIQFARQFASSVNLIRTNWIESSGNIDIDYKQLQHDYSLALIELLNSTLKQSSQRFEPRIKASVVRYLKHRGFGIGNVISFDRSDHIAMVSESLLHYFSAYDFPPASSVELAQNARKNALISHWSFLKSTKLIYSLRSIPAVPFDTLVRYKYIGKSILKRHIIRK